MGQSPFMNLQVKKLPAFYRTWQSTTAFTSACHLSLSWARSIQSMSLHPILKTHLLHLVLPRSSTKLWLRNS